MEGPPQTPPARLTPEQLGELATRPGVDASRPGQVFPNGSAEADLCAATAARLHRDPPGPAPALEGPADLGRTPTGVASTQAALGRTLLGLNRAAPETGRRSGTGSPDGASSPNLG